MRLFRYHPKTGWQGATFHYMNPPYKCTNPFEVCPVLPKMGCRDQPLKLTVASYLEDRRGKRIILSKPAIFCVGQEWDDEKNELYWNWFAYCLPSHLL